MISRNMLLTGVCVEEMHYLEIWTVSSCELLQSVSTQTEMYNPCNAWQCKFCDNNRVHANMTCDLHFLQNVPRL